MNRSAAAWLLSSVVALGAMPAGQTPASLEVAAREAERAGHLNEAFDLFLRAVRALPEPAPLDPDIRLRASLIALARRIEPRPIVPAEGRSLADGGRRLLLDARDRRDVDRAAIQLRHAVRAAPWVGDLARDLALADERLEAYRSAAANLRLYLLAEPPDAARLREKAAGLDLKAEQVEAVLRNPVAKPADPSGAAEPDVNFVPTPAVVIEAMLDLAEVTKADVVYDLGCGDGRIVLAAARRGARGVGIDLDPGVLAQARANAQAAGVEDRVEFIEADLFRADIRRATVVTLYLLPGLNLRLRPTLLADLAPGSRVVSHAFDMSEWAPERAAQAGDDLVLLWRIPPRRRR